MLPKVHVVGGAIRRDDRLLVALRGPTMSLPGKWEFPGGKVEADELPEAALARELAEELGVRVTVGERIGRGQVAQPHCIVVLDVYWCEIASGDEPIPREHAELRWLAVSDLDDLDWAAADLPIVEILTGGQ